MKIRLTADLKDSIESAAKANNRSMNSEIVSRLLESLEGQPAFKPALKQQKEQLVDLMERRNTLVLLLSAVDEKSAPSDEVLMLKRRLAEIELAIENTERRIRQFQSSSP